MKRKRIHRTLALLTALAAASFTTGTAAAADFTLTDSSNADFIAALPTLLATENVTINNTGTNTYSGYSIVTNTDTSTFFDLSVTGTGGLTIGNFNTASGTARLGAVSTNSTNLTLQIAANMNASSLFINNASLAVTTTTGRSFWNSGETVFGPDGGSLNLTVNYNFHLTGPRTTRTTAPTGTPAAPIASAWTSFINMNGQCMTFDVAENTVLTQSGGMGNFGYYTKTGAGTLVLSGGISFGVYQDRSLIPGKSNVSTRSVTISEGTLKLTGSGTLSTGNKTLTDTDGTTQLTDQWRNLVPIINNATIELASTRTQEVRNLSGTNASALIKNTAGAMTLTLFNDTDTTYAGAIRGSSMTLNKQGDGSLTISGADLESGWSFAAVNVTGGSLSLSPATSRSGKGTSFSAITVNGGTLTLGSNLWQCPTFGPITFGVNGGTLTNSSNLYNNNGAAKIVTTENGADSVFNSSWNTNTHMTEFAVAANSQLKVTGAIWNIGGMTKTGAGTLLLTSNSTFSNRIIGTGTQTAYAEKFVDLKEGTVVISTSQPFGNGAQDVLDTVKLNSQSASSSVTLRSTGANLTLANYFDVDGVGSNVIEVTGTNRLTIAHLGGTGTLTKTGSGTLFLGGIAQSTIDAINSDYNSNENSYYAINHQTYASPLNASLGTLRVEDGALSPTGGTPLTVTNLELAGGDYLIDSMDDLIIVKDSLTFSDESQILLNVAPTQPGQSVEIFRFESGTMPADLASYVSTPYSNWLFESAGGSFYAMANSSALPEPSAFLLGVLGILGVCGVCGVSAARKRSFCKK